MLAGRYGLSNEAAMSERPILWQIPVSHYSEKARWALAWKGVDHERRSPPPGGHMAVALWLTRGSRVTFPILTLDGRNVPDSTAIIAALEQRHPDPPLYPEDPEERRRGHGLEDFFVEELGPHARLLAFYELRSDRDRFRRVVEQTVPPPLRRFGGPATAYARTYTKIRFGVADPEAAELARAKIVAAFDRLESELDANGGEYLVGESFTVADLTAASLFFPVVQPQEGPVATDVGAPEGLESFRGPLKERPGYIWVEEMFSRHRRPAPAASATG
jgi:glutathione S-transferase